MPDLISATLNTSPVKVIEPDEIVPVWAFDNVQVVDESMDATTAPAAMLVPDTAMPTARPVTFANPVRPNWPDVPLTPVFTTVALKQCNAEKRSLLNDVKNAVVIPAIDRLPAR